MKFTQLFLPLIVVVCVSFTPKFNCIAQTPNYLSDSLYQTYFNTLKDGVLLIRLSDRFGIRENLEKHGETDKLAQLDQRIQQEHQEIFEAFRKNYTFGKVLFFYKSESHLLVSGQFGSMKLFDNQGNKIPSSEFNFDDFLIGEFGKINRPQRGPIIPDKSGSKNSDQRSAFSAFVIMNANFKPIDKSYYLFIRLILKSKSGTIRKFNKRLERNARLLKSQTLKDNKKQG